jgi:ferredoxin
MNQKMTGLYFSPTGTTKRVVEAIASALGGTTEFVDFTKVDDRQHPVSFGPDDYVVVGVPVYAGRIPAVPLSYLERIKGEQTPVVCVVVYGNREYDDALLELKDLMEAKGFIVHAAAAFIGEHSYTNLVAGGRPDEEDLEEARQFGIAAWEKYLQEKSTNSPHVVLHVKGNYPYRDRAPSQPMAPTTTDDCIFCGLCAQVCPVEAIDFEDYFTTDATRCIRCTACIKICPKNAKFFDHPMIEKITASLIANVGHLRKVPEKFL